MSTEKFNVIMGILIPQVVALIMDNYGWDETIATKEFYGSAVYEVLEEEDTKLWHFSPMTLFSMFDEEKKTGAFVFPEEA